MKKIMAVTLLVMAAWFLCGALNQPKQETEMLPITVGKGSTLWSIAEANIQYTNYTDIREFIYVIKQDNNLGRTGYIYPGQKLLIRVNKDK